MSEPNDQRERALYIYTKSGLRLEDALAAHQKVLGEESLPAVAMIYATNKCCFARLQTGGQLLDEDGQTLNLKSVYEARVFNEKAELRWRHTESGNGDVALLTEDAKEFPNWKPEKTILAGDPIKQKYLLWGESLRGESKHDWIKLATPRIGHYFAPVEHNVEVKTRVQLNAREYLRKENEHGNIFVFEERWLGLSTVDVQKQGKTKEANNG